MPTEWTPDSWRSHEAIQMPDYPDQAELGAVEKELAAQNYLDLAASWNATKGLTISAGINNLFDKDPPITSQLSTGTGNGNTYPGTYDALGRKVFLTASYKF